MKINGSAKSEKTNPKQTQTNPISEKPKMSLNFYSTKDYDNKTRFPAPGKQTQFKPNQTQFHTLSNAEGPPQSSHSSQLPAAEIKPRQVILSVDVRDPDDVAELFWSIVFLADSLHGLCLGTTGTEYRQQDRTKILVHLIWAKLFFAASMVFSISSGVWASETNIAS